MLKVLNVSTENGDHVMSERRYEHSLRILKQHSYLYMIKNNALILIYQNLKSHCFQYKQKE